MTRADVSLPYFGMWFVLALIGVANGSLREASYGAHLPELFSHQLSTLTGIVFTGLAVWRFQRRWPIASARQAWTTGGCWLLMTVAFEFGFGHLVAGHSWASLLADYNLLHGRVWSLFLLWMLVMPRVFYGSRAR